MLFLMIFVVMVSGIIINYIIGENNVTVNALIALIEYVQQFNMEMLFKFEYEIKSNCDLMLLIAQILTKISDIYMLIILVLINYIYIK
jgi:hypothetical protein